MSQGGSMPRGNSSLSSTFIKESESQAKFCQSRVALVEKNYGNLCETLGSITRKAARQRDKGDLLAKQLQEYANSENISHCTKAGLSLCAQNMSAIQDYREAEIKRLEAKVVHPLSGYGDICKKKKKEISTELGNIKKEQKTLQQLDKVRTKSPGDQHQIQAETEVKRANTDSEMGGKALEEQMVVFEKQRLGDLKNSLADFINIEMIFHARALEYYARCFENIVMIDEDRDLQEFKRKLQSSKGMRADFGQTLGGFTGGSSTGGSDTLGTGSSYTYTYGDTSTATASASDARRVRISNTSMMYGEDDDDDELYDDDDDDDYSVPRRTGMR
ncbi:CBY1-interacting BAR domain-containing protein 1-like [Mytilus galloprovincialis]|uniref:CBY1-interacting BAR domain-containing protein 1-like n=1 Tax=Mytilus galloprovincialis TaxID=29158 RepID=UPI003F7C67AB